MKSETCSVLPSEPNFSRSGYIPEKGAFWGRPDVKAECLERLKKVRLERAGRRNFPRTCLSDISSSLFSGRSTNLPAKLRGQMDCILYGMKDEDAESWTERALAAIPVGALSNGAASYFFLFLLLDPESPAAEFVAPEIRSVLASLPVAASERMTADPAQLRKQAELAGWACVAFGLEFSEMETATADLEDWRDRTSPEVRPTEVFPVFEAAACAALAAREERMKTLKGMDWRSVEARQLRVEAGLCRTIAAWLAGFLSCENALTYAVQSLGIQLEDDMYIFESRNEFWKRIGDYLILFLERLSTVSSSEPSGHPLEWHFPKVTKEELLASLCLLHGALAG